MNPIVAPFALSATLLGMGFAALAVWGAWATGRWP